MTSHIGARKCFFCGVSTVRGPRRRSQRPIQSYLLTGSYMADHRNIIEYARYLFEDRQITVQDRICRPCLQRADRFVATQIRGRKREEVMQLSFPLKEEKAALASHQAFIDIKHEPSFSQSSELQSDPLRVTHQEYVKDVLLKEEYILPTEEDILLKEEYIAPEKTEQMPLKMPVKTKTPLKTKTPVISVPGFSRIPFSSTNCIKAGCNNRKNLHRINLQLRNNILLKQNIYIQNGVRVCEEHLRDSALWLDLAVHGRLTIDTFNSAQIADMLQMLQKRNLHYLKFVKQLPAGFCN